MPQANNSVPNKDAYLGPSLVRHSSASQRQLKYTSYHMHGYIADVTSDCNQLDTITSMFSNSYQEVLSDTVPAHDPPICGKRRMTRNPNDRMHRHAILRRRQHNDDGDRALPNQDDLHYGRICDWLGYFRCLGLHARLDSTFAQYRPAARADLDY